MTETTTKILNPKYSHLFFLACFLATFIWSTISPYDRFTWFLETLPAIVGATILIALYRRFRFTTLAYSLICLHAVILCIGGHYTYAQVPLFNWIRDTFELSRNHYDRIGHFMQGFAPAIVAREILIRTSPLKKGKWLNFLVICICLALSAFYELIEWWVAATTGTAAEAFLGTQGDVWDTQWDMSLALLGATASLVLLSEMHDKSLNRHSVCKPECIY